MRKQRLTGVVFGALALVATTCCAQAPAANPQIKPDSADAHIKSVVAITRVFADGFKVTGAAVEYDKPIRAASLSPSDYVVKTDVPSQKITGAYTSTDGKDFTKTGQSGQYVVLELSTDYVFPVRTGTGTGPVNQAAQGARPANQGAGPGNPGAGPANQGGGPQNQGAGQAQGQGGAGGAGNQAARPAPPKVDWSMNPEVVLKVGDISWDPTAHPAVLVASKQGGDGKDVSVTQVGNITTTDGMTITAGTIAKDNYYARNPIVDGFIKTGYQPPSTGGTGGGGGGGLKNNVHFPRDYDVNKKYPLILFLTDSNAVVRYVHAEALTQGLGGVIWADKDEEARHEAIVVVPTLRGSLVNDSYQPGQQQSPNGSSSNTYQTVLGMVDSLVKTIPSIDKDRVYVTGQGEGARAAIRMMIDRPDLFAAALLFAPDYDPAQMAKLSKANLWIVSAEGDDASYPKMESSMDSLKAAGARISKAEWNGQANSKEFATDVHSLTAQSGNIKFTVLKKGTVVPSGVADNAANDHAYTWRIGYTIQGLRDWLFTQKK